MRSPRLAAAAGLLLCATAIALANLWFAAARSTIPLSLDDTVVERKVLAEKHAGIDDVYLVVLHRGGAMQVDKAVFDQLERGDHVTKSAWFSQLYSADRLIDLTWSADLRGLVVVMPGALLAIVAMVIAIRVTLPG